jgi:hypothetical protein
MQGEGRVQPSASFTTYAAIWISVKPDIGRVCNTAVNKMYFDSYPSDTARSLHKFESEIYKFIPLNFVIEILYYVYFLCYSCHAIEFHKLLIYMELGKTSVAG